MQQAQAQAQVQVQAQVQFEQDGYDGMCIFVFIRLFVWCVRGGCLSK